MRYQGKIISWNEERGFGFIKWNGADDKLFVHISALGEKRRKPVAGDIVTYEVGKDAKGRSRALNVAYVIPVKRNASARSGKKSGLGYFALIGLVVVFGIAKYAPQELISWTGSESAAQNASSQGKSTWISEQSGNASDAVIADAFSNHQSNIQVSGQGIVARLLPDDNDGSRHQRFILRLASGQTLLIAHNIDIAPRIDSLREGGTVAFYGQYEWNEKGGVIHWTHRDTRGSHADGWLRYQGQTYQ